MPSILVRHIWLRLDVFGIDEATVWVGGKPETRQVGITGLLWEEREGELKFLARIVA